MHSLYKQGNLPYLTVKLCQNCEKLIPINSECCPHCSYNFTSRTMDKPLSIKKETPVQEYKPVETYAAENNVAMSSTPAQEVKKPEKFVFCNNCGSKIIGSQRYCGGCGVKVSKRLCPSCNEIIDSDLMFCSYCGEKLQESPVNNVKPAETPVTNQQNTITLRIEGAEKTYEPVKEEVKPVEEVSPIEEAKPAEPVEAPFVFEGVNMGRKRLFVIIQFFLVAIIAAIMVMVPLLTEGNLFTDLIDCFKRQSDEPFMNGIGVYKYILECIANKGITVGETSISYKMLTNGEGQFVLTNIPIFEPLMSFISDKGSVKHLIPLGATLLSYLLMVLSMLIVFISSIVGLFSKKIFRGKALGSLTIMLFISCLLIYSSVFFDAFKGYQSWLIYAFALCFLVWFIIKLVFLKENKLYKSYKRLQKESK